MNFHAISIEYWTILPWLLRAELHVFSQLLLKRDSMIFSFSLVFVFQMFSQSSHLVFLHPYTSFPRNWVPLTTHSGLVRLNRQCKNPMLLVNPPCSPSPWLRPYLLVASVFYLKLNVQRNQRHVFILKSRMEKFILLVKNLILWNHTYIQC